MRLKAVALCEMHYIVDNSIDGDLISIAHTVNRIAVFVLGICVRYADAIAGNVAAEELLPRGFICDDDAVGKSADDGRPGNFNSVPVESPGGGCGRRKSATHVG